MPFTSPSVLDGIPPEEERRQLAFASDFVRESCLALSLSQRVCANSQMLLHRFYTQVSLIAHNTVWAAGACVNLSAKLADEPRSLRHVANVLYDRLVDRQNVCVETVAIEGRNYRRPLNFYGAEGYDWKNALIETERHVLKELGFRLAVELPHNFVLIFVNTLRDKAGAPGWSEGHGPFNTLLQAAWDYANDLLIDQICVREAPEVLACACISLATSHCEGTLPEGWEHVLGSSTEECQRLAKYLKDLYEHPIEKSCYRNFSNSTVLEHFSVKLEEKAAGQTKHEMKKRRFEEETAKEGCSSRPASPEAHTHDCVALDLKCEDEKRSVQHSNGLSTSARLKKKRRRFEDAVS
ncbi:cyclin-L1 [Gracilaria domingensis]|nr:cyclin-L1 [Gracilaria domingensis]